MTPADPAYLASIVDRLEEYVPVQTRRFFGGIGLLYGEVQFAMVMGDTLYLVVDDVNRPSREAAGAEPFTYQTRRGQVTVGRYYTVPAHVLDDQEALRTWTAEAIQSAQTRPVGARRRPQRAAGLGQV